MLSTTEGVGRHAIELTPPTHLGWIQSMPSFSSAASVIFRSIQLHSAARRPISSHRILGGLREPVLATTNSRSHETGTTVKSRVDADLGRSRVQELVEGDANGMITYNIQHIYSALLCFDFWWSYSIAIRRVMVILHEELTLAWLEFQGLGTSGAN